MEHCWDSGAGHQGEHDVVQERAHQAGPGGGGVTAAEEVSTSGLGQIQSIIETYNNCIDLLKKRDMMCSLLSLL